MMEILKTINLSVGYHFDNTLLSKLELSVSEGDKVAIIGRNGKGKTTLIRTLAGLMKPIEGEVLVNNENLSNINERKKAEFLSVVLTDQPGIGNISVKQLISYGRYPFTGLLGIEKKEDKLHIEKAIDACDLNQYLDKKLYELSDGERQKVMIARCIAQNTPLMLLDEPTAHLDVTNKSEVFELLNKLAAEEKIAIIYITHELSFAMKYSNKIWLINDQRVLSGDAESFSNNELLAEAFDVPTSNLGIG